MWYLLLGVGAFLFLFLFDLRQKAGRGGGGILFFLGCLLLLAGSCFVTFTGEPSFVLPLFWRVYFWCLAAVSLAGMVWALFFALPFHSVYVEGKQSQAVTAGLYALCRHPGVLFFFLLYLCLWLACGRALAFWAMLLWTGADILHVWIQDKFFFPYTLMGYTAYQKSTPFLVPTPSSIKSCLRTLGRKERRG